MVKGLVSIFAVAVLSISNFAIEANIEEIPDYKVGYEYTDEKCKTPPLDVNFTKELILTTQTKDLNFVALAKKEGGLYNQAKNGRYLGIFQVDYNFHQLDDYCDPVEQVEWLEWKLDQGAKPENLFPNTYKLLYTPAEES